MQHAGVGAAGDDRRIGRRLRAAAAEFVQQFGFDLVFGAAGRGRAHRAPVGRGRYLRRAPHGRQFVRVLDEPHVVEQGAHVGDRGRRRDAIAHLRAHRVQPAQHARVPRLVAAEMAVQRRLIRKQFRQQCIKLADRMALVEMKLFPRPLGSIAKAVPDFALDVLVATEQYASAVVTRNQHQHRFRLGKTGQIVKIAVVAIGIMRVAIARSFGRRRDDGDAALHALRQPRAPFGVNRGNPGCDLKFGHARIIRRARDAPIVRRVRGRVAASRSGVPMSCQRPR